MKAAYPTSYELNRIEWGKYHNIKTSKYQLPLEQNKVNKINSNPPICVLTLISRDQGDNSRQKYP